MPTLKLNHRQVIAARPLHGKRTQYRIAGVRGLVLDVRVSGERTWFVRYQPGGRKQRVFRWYKIGDAGLIGIRDAADKAGDILRAVQKDSRDPHAERVRERKKARTFGALFEDWHARYAIPRLKRADTDRFLFGKHIEDSFGKLPLSDLQRTDVGRFRDRVAAEWTALTADSVIVLVNRVLNWAVDEGLTDVNPAARLRKLGNAKPRERILSHGGIRRFAAALDAIEKKIERSEARSEKGPMLSAPTRSILRLLLLTGQRRGEVAGASKSEFELDGPDPIWTIPGSRTKNGLLHRVPLCPMAADEFRCAIAAAGESEFVFPSPVNRDVAIKPMAVTRAMSRLVAELGLPVVSPHDLRRTVGTEMARLGVPLHIRSHVLNHSPASRGVTDAVYNRYAYDDEKRNALASWEQQLKILFKAARTTSRKAA